MAEVRIWLDGALEAGGVRLPVRETAAFLDAVASERSLRAAAERLSISYRSAWDRAARLEAAFGIALVSKTKGHGTVLTPAGEAVRAALAEARGSAAGVLAAAEAALRHRVSNVVRPTRTRIALSHDPVLVDILAAMPDVEVAVVGSSDALRRLRDCEADLAGFHARPEPELGRSPAFDDLDIHPLFRREQGLIVAAGNPLRIVSIEDLRRSEIRFVNRQKGSGTRGWTDALLAEAGLPPEAVRGYATEEFTHGAVAAMVASGMADAGIGVRSAADRFGLGFVPLGIEVYSLASRRRESPPLLHRLLTALSAPAEGGPA